MMSSTSDRIASLFLRMPSLDVKAGYLKVTTTSWERNSSSLLQTDSCHGAQVQESVLV